MNWLDMIGYAASVLTFMTFYMNSMLPLRYVALCSNVAFIAYGYFSGLPPVFFLHLALFPLNCVRVLQLRKLITQVREAGQADVSIEPLLPYMTTRRFRAGDTLFRKGEPARELYYVLEGAIHVEEVRMEIGRGQIAGVIGVFAPQKERPWTAICKTDGKVLMLPHEKVLQSFCENPRFGMSLAMLLSKRAIADVSGALKQ